jgi:hypothetical protein
VYVFDVYIFIMMYINKCILYLIINVFIVFAFQYLDAAFGYVWKSLVVFAISALFEMMEMDV